MTESVTVADSAEAIPVPTGAPVVERDLWRVLMDCNVWSSNFRISLRFMLATRSMDLWRMAGCACRAVKLCLAAHGVKVADMAATVL